MANVPPQALFPNSLLILAALDVDWFLGDTASPKTWEVGSRIGKNAAWVLRHGVQLRGSGWPEEGGGSYDHGYASMATNGHCRLEAAGREIAHLLRSAVPPDDENQGCQTIHGCLRLSLKDGTIRRWVPDHIPGMPRAEVPARSQKHQHTGQWITVVRAGQFCGHYWQGLGYEDGPYPSQLQDGSAVTPAMQVQVCRKVAWNEGEIGEVLAFANGSAIVRFPSDGVIPMATRHLLRPGTPDTSDLSTAQLAVLGALRDGAARVIRGDDGGGVALELAGKKVHQRTVDILIEKGVITPQGELLRV